jgi:hypothetical protein
MVPANRLLSSMYPADALSRSRDLGILFLKQLYSSQLGLTDFFAHRHRLSSGLEELLAQ